MDKVETQIQTQPKSNNNNTTIIVAVVIGVLLLGGISAGIYQKGQPQPAPAQNQNPTTSPKNIPANTTQSVIMYGTWSGGNALVKAYDIEKKQTYMLGTFPQNIKRISAVMPDTLYFINNTDANDHGTEITKYALSTKQQTSLIKAEPGYGIDDYLVSQNGNYITTWEIKLAPGANSLIGATSRVYAVDTNNPTQKHLLYNEMTNKPIHYPRAITNNAKVLTDMFLPNSGPGWGYGMSDSDLTGQQKQNVQSMPNGSYGRQPRSAYDGSQLVFAGYDGTLGSGTQIINGERRAISNPNTVELLSSDTLARTKLKLTNKAIYDDARFDKSDNYIFISQIADASNSPDTKILLYNLTDNTTKELQNSTNKRGLAVFSDGKVLVASLNTSKQAMGNLGETYQYVNNSYELIDPSNGQTTTLSVNDINTGFIGIFPSQAVAQAALSQTNVEASGEEGLQLRSFELKAALLDQRTNLESNPAVGANNNGSAAVSGTPSGAPNAGVPSAPGVGAPSAPGGNGNQPPGNGNGNGNQPPGNGNGNGSIGKNEGGSQN